MSARDTVRAARWRLRRDRSLKVFTYEITAGLWYRRAGVSCGRL